MPISSPSLDRVFFALSDATRLAVLSQLSQGPAPVSQLAQPFDMALPSFTQHLGVLEEQGLVTSHKEGRVRTYQLKPRPLLLAENWLEQRRNFWERRLDQLDRYLLEMNDDESGQA